MKKRRHKDESPLDGPEYTCVGCAWFENKAVVGPCRECRRQLRLKDFYKAERATNDNKAQA
jgi:hypothetical protein